MPLEFTGAPRLVWSVPRVYQADQSAVIISRLGLMAPLVAAFTVAWIALDVLGMGTSMSQATAPVRLLLAASLLLLWRVRTRLPVYAALGAFVWIQAAGFGVIEYLLDSHDRGPSVGYGLFPFVIASQLAIFPLTWLHSLRLGIAPALLLVGDAALRGTLSGSAFANDAWLLSVILGLSAWGGHLQIRLLVQLLAARRDASLDPLTGLANRRTSERRLQTERARASRRQAALSVFMLDLDHFKRVNDTWGHACGDLVLVEVARVMQEELRGSDLGARFGGEEFLAVLPDTDAAQALQVAERIRERIAALEIAASDDRIRVTASIGIATMLADEPMDALVARADAALYAAKAGGRNRCVADGVGTPAASEAPSS